MRPVPLKAVAHSLIIVCVDFARKKEEHNAVFYLKPICLIPKYVIDPMLLKSRCIIDHNVMPARTVSSHNSACNSREKEKKMLEFMLSQVVGQWFTLSRQSTRG